MANERLRRAIRDVPLSYEQVAERLGVDVKTVQRWVTKDRVPHPRTRARLAAMVGADELYLWPDAADQPPAGTPTPEPSGPATRWRKRPLVVEAIRYDGSAGCLGDIGTWSNGRVRPSGDLAVCLTAEGERYVNVGDWVIRGVAGEFYPVMPDVFEASYDRSD